MEPELVSTEEVVNALLEYLVGPRLPLKSSAFKEPPTLSQQQSVAQQLHAVVLLYNYYQRKEDPQAQYLDFESFCKLAMTLKPALMSYMKFMNQSDLTSSKDMNNDLSVTEKAIQDACNISCALDASKDVPAINKWLISKVSVLLLDSKKETCFLNYCSVTEGVWSLIEKCLELPTAEIEGTVERRKRQTSMRPVTVDQKDDDSGFQQLAFLAVKDATGISKTDLVTLEKHVVYSLTKEKTASCFYIMQSTRSINQDILISVKEIIESLQGPLVKRSSGSWSATEVVEYFHLLPYANIIATFFLREVFGLEGSNTRSHEDITGNCKKEISASRISLVDQNSGNVSIMTAIGSESACSNVANDVYDRKVNPADAFGAEVVADSGCERKTGDQKDFGKENGLHHHHETVRTHGRFSGKAKKTSASNGNQGVEEKVKKIEGKTPDESYEALIGTKSDSINLEISEAKHGDGCHEKVGHSAVGQEATAVGGPHNMWKSEEAGSDSSIKNTGIVDLSGNKLTNVNLKCLNGTSNKVQHENSRDYEDSTVKELHAIIDHPRTPEEKTEELVKSTKGCEINDYNDMELAGAHLETLEVKTNDGHHFSSSPTRPQRMEIDACIPFSKNGNNSKDCELIKKVYHQQKKRTRESGGEIIGSGIICKAERADEVKADKDNLSTISPNRNGISVAHTRLVPCKHESTDIGDLQTVLASKEEALTKSSLEVLLQKRQKLYDQQLKLGDEIASCDKSIERILDGGKDSLALKIDTVLAFCDEMCLKDRASIQEDGNQHHEEFGLIQPMSGRKLSKAVHTP
ncbi:hypothetical protein KY290_012460 [Solanum tuberosum]|uniref:Uncharacterized protein n=1 Tax=Solanum tuberosum TaxID=4113 RepID=A0ABQ7W3L6_SOLTU|nr:hypothetical protein KY289_013006 [Solanum tuberosum]KAH0711137.1 hypothetical protein KY284_012564 [Solanum tuberosum]KAH0736249.1 hypothetical protein KY285_011956 [Solanum tuberosum]KAH0775323.1 hypothetical protein KY290_012460 [Solanum tuberosum]